ncbi:hypothetical protein LCGC14_1878760 [marine sediment metagenome]|uniref:Uncharacterized protein n=1 Tax=marine sediment metagenome TaxID=412755 RepID=A0A0F9G2V0_9ZZZZ
MIEWDEYRRDDKTIDLKKLFGATHLQGTLSMKQWGIVVGYFREIELVHRIKSRQAAAIAIAHARHLVRIDKEQTWQSATSK